MQKGIGNYHSMYEVRSIPWNFQLQILNKQNLALFYIKHNCETDHQSILCNWKSINGFEKLLGKFMKEEFIREY